MFSVLNAELGLLRGMRKLTDEEARASPLLWSASGWYLGLFITAWGQSRKTLEGAAVSLDHGSAADWWGRVGTGSHSLSDSVSLILNWGKERWLM